MNIKDCDYLVSILNLEVERLGYDVDTEGFGYDDECEISCANGDSLQEGLRWLWSELINKIIICQTGAIRPTNA